MLAADATPAWALLGFPGGANYTLQTDATDPTWVDAILKQVDQDADYVGVTIRNADANTAAAATLSIQNAAGINNALSIKALGTGFTTSPPVYQDGAVIQTGSSLSGALTIRTIPDTDVIFATAATRVNMQVGSAGLEVNPGGADLDTQIQAAGVTDALFVQGSNGFVGAGINPPISRLHVYENTASVGATASLTIEQDGAGDAVTQWLLTGGQRWVAGIDNSDSDKFKIASTADLDSNAHLTITTGGKILLNADDEDTNILATTNVQVIDTRLAVSQEGTSNAFDVYAYGTTFVPKVTFKHARGTRATPTATQSGDFMGAFDFTGYGAAFYDSGGAQISGLAAENWAAGNRGAHLVLATTPAGSASGSERMRITDAGMVGISETTNANMDIGLVINQKAFDTEALNIRSSDVGAVLSAVETGTWLACRKGSGAAGGIRLQGFRDADGGNREAMGLFGYLAEDADTTKTTAARAIIELHAYQTDGSAIEDTVSNGNLLALRTQRGASILTVSFWDEDGDYYYNGALNSYDHLADEEMARDVQLVLTGREGVRYNQDAMVEAGILHPSEHGMTVSHKRLTALQLGAHRQAYDDRRALERRIEQLEKELKKCQ
jgi:hypothetical protein